MKLPELLEITAAVIGALASVVMTVEQRLVKRFRRASATSSATATALPPLAPLSRWRLSRLTSARAVVVDELGRGYLDEAVYRALRKKRAILGVSLVVCAIAGVVLVYTALQ